MSDFKPNNPKYDYIGSTGNFRERIDSYVRDGTLRPGDKVLFYPISKECTQDQLRDAEREHIDRHGTYENGANKSRGGEGRPWKNPVLQPARKTG